MESTVNLPVVGMDIAKNVFQLHWVDAPTGQIKRRTLKRDRVLTFFANREVSLIAMEACGGAHHWARTLQEQGHQVKLLPAGQVRPFVPRDKTDATDAQGIWVAAQQRHIHAVAVKSVSQQAALSLHRLRHQLMKVRTMQTNLLRSQLLEFGLTLPVGYRPLLAQIDQALVRAQAQLPDYYIVTLQEQVRRILDLQADMDAIEQRIIQQAKDNAATQAIMAIPGVGPLSATAVVASMAQPESFSSARQFAAWLGLTPRQTGTGGKVRQLGISKRGDRYLRTLLMHGARAVIARSTPTSWIARLLARRPYCVVVAALANKLARTIWAVLVKGKPFDPAKWNPETAALVV